MRVLLALLVGVGLHLLDLGVLVVALVASLVDRVLTDGGVSRHDGGDGFLGVLRSIWLNGRSLRFDQKLKLLEEEVGYLRFANSASKHLYATVLL